jgi:hypothetical protein
VSEWRAHEYAVRRTGPLQARMCVCTTFIPTYIHLNTRPASVGEPMPYIARASVLIDGRVAEWGLHAASATRKAATRSCTCCSPFDICVVIV